MTPDEFRVELSAQGLTQRAFAALVDTTPSAVQRWVQGQRPIPGWVPVLLRFRGALRKAGLLAPTTTR